MKKLLLVIFLFTAFCCCLLQTFSQNLVPNPSFEDYTQCPNGQCQVIYATGWDSYSYSPDYFNACASTFSVPNNPIGYQFAATGNAYVGMGFYCCGDTINEQREYIGTQLISPLEIGKRYKSELKISLAGNDINCCAVNKIGVLFSTISYTMGPICTHTPILLPNNFAHIFTNDVISDTVNWVNISGTFIADSAYQYVIIGNFFHNDSTDFITVSPNPNAFLGTYYFIDDIYVGLDTANSINEISQSYFNSISISPNPASNYLTIDPPRNNSTIKIFNSLGNIVHTEYLLATNKKTIEINAFPDGLYIMQVSFESAQLFQKFVINH